MRTTNERELAAEILTEITASAAYNNLSLQRALRNTALSPEQRAFVTELVNGSLRNLIYLDSRIARVSTVKLTKLRPFILNTLRISVYQILFLTRVPDSAACNEAVKLVKARGLGRLSGFVNGVLRAVARAGTDAAAEPSVRYSYPEWLAAHFARELGESTALTMFEANAKPPGISVAVNTLRTDARTLGAMLEAEGMSVRPSAYFEDVLRLSRTGDLARSPAFGAGLFHVQDESSVLAVRLLSPQPGGVMLDVCAAPGGKSLYAAYLMRDSGTIRAFDLHAHKLELIKNSAQRLGIGSITTGLKDAAVFDPALDGTADYLLIDAPCSGLGLIRKKPDVKYRKRPEDIPALAGVQREILAACARYVKPGGVLVYSTCTISAAENTDNLRWFTDNFPFEPQDIRPLLPPGISGGGFGYIQLIPGVHDMDGFFIARLIRRRTP